MRGKRRRWVGRRTYLFLVHRLVHLYQDDQPIEMYEQIHFRKLKSFISYDGGELSLLTSSPTTTATLNSSTTSTTTSILFSISMLIFLYLIEDLVGDSKIFDLR